LSEGLPSAASKDANIGSVAHLLAEKCLLTGGDPSEYIDSCFDEYPDIQVTEDMAGNVQIYLDAINDAKSQLSEDAVLSIEQKFNLSWLHPDLFGSNDACLVDLGNILWVFDYKNGTYSVDHVENEQLMYYALGALYDNFGLFTEVRMTIVQPRSYHNEGKVRTWSTTPERLMEFADQLLDRALATEDKNAHPSSGDHCFFCPAKGAMDSDGKMRCSAFTDKTFKTAEQSFAQFLETKTLNLPAPQEMSPDFIKLILDSADAFESWVSGVRGYASHLAINWDIIPTGYKLSQRRKNRRWIDEEQVVTELQPILGDDIFSKPKVLTPAQMEKLVKKSANWISIENLYEKPEGDLVLVPETSERESSKPRLASEAFASFIDSDLK
jgi:hypothetical protein